MNELINPLAWTRVRADASSRRYGGNELPSEMIALEPRVMLDGAIAMAAVEEAPADEGAAADDKGATGEPAAQGPHSETDASAENSGTTSETEAASGNEPGKTIVIVDAAIEDPAALLEGIDPSAEVFFLIDSADGVEQITNILAGQSNVSSLHILSHGDTGSVTIGATTLTTSNIETYAADFVGWDLALAEGSDILLYGCNVAEDQTGLDFIDLFAELTHTDVAASTNLTGGDAVGGDWVLEAQTGATDAPSPLNAMALAGYQYTLVFEEIGDNDFRISEVGSSGSPAGSAIRPEIAYNSTDNEYLVVWRGSEPDVLSGPTESEIFGRRVDADTGMVIGSDFRISDVDGDGNSSAGIGDPNVAYNSVDNEYLVVWSAEDPDFGLTDGDEIFGQRIAADGTEIGIDFQISDAHSGEFRGGFEPDVTYNSVENEYLVVWHADDVAASLSKFQYEIFGQRIDGATGAALGTNDFRISTTGPAATHQFDATSAAIAYNSRDNEYLVTWEANKQDAGITGDEIFGQRLSGVDGTEIGVDDFQISDATTFAFGSDVAYNSDDNQYLIIWHSNDPGAGLDPGEFEIFGQRLTGTGNQIGANDFRISDVGGTGDPDFDARDARVAYNAADKEYLVVWASSDTGAGLASNPSPFGDDYEIEIFGQRLNGQTGADVGTNDFLISDVQGIGQTVDGSVGRPALAFNSTNSEILVVWHARDLDDTGAIGIGQGIFGQRLADVPPNEAPVHSVPGPQFANQGDTLNFNEANGTLISVNDADAGTGQITTTIILDPGFSFVANSEFDSLSGTGVAGDPLILAKTGTIAEINAALAQLVVTVNAGTGGQTLAITLSTNDGGNTGSGGAQTTVEVINVHVETANTSPTLSGLNGTPTFTEGGTAVLIDADVSVGDSEQNWNGGTLTVSGLDAADTVAVRNSGTGAGQTSLSGSNIIVDGRIVASFAGGGSGTDLIITFTAGASNAAVATILENLAFSNGSNAPAATRTLTITIADGDGADASGAVTATVNAVNDDPVNTVPGAQPTNEDTPLVFSAANGNALSVSDADASASDITTTLSVTSGTLSVTATAAVSNNDTATVTITGTVTEVNAALTTVTFTPALHASGQVTLTMTTNDNGNTGTGGALTDTDTVAITVTPVADTPTISLPTIFSTSIELSSLNGANGFVLNGIDTEDFSGISVSGAGDVNGDGFDDIIIGADKADPNGLISAGESYVVFGSDQGFAASIDLSSLDGVTGFVINGIVGGDRSGQSVSGAGDINGDGIDDIVIGAQGADPNGIGAAGESYVVFGSDQGFAASIDLSNLNGVTGFAINGIDTQDLSGHSVSGAGDINGDGIDDIIIGAYNADPNGIGDAGESYVVFGSDQGFAASIDLSSLNGASGFVINGIDAQDRSGLSVSGAGDVNGDGIDDLVIGARFADPNGVESAGASYVVFGSDQGFGASIDLSSLDGTTGFLIKGIDEFDISGHSISGAGDINGDGIDDIVIGARAADPNGKSFAGASYVVFGSDQGFAASVELSGLDGATGFVINGIDADDSSGQSVSGAGDINGDGIDDLVIGADRAKPNGNTLAGESYVIFGSDQGFAASIELSSLKGETGFVINGIDHYDGSGFSVSGAGDINGDGFDDLVIGASGATPNGVSFAGETYVLFGFSQTQPLEDTAFGIDLSAVLADQDGSETLAVTLSGFPAGTSFNLGDAGAGNSWVIGNAQALDLSTLELSPPADFNGAFTLTATARATEGANGSFAEATATVDIDIAPVNDAPIVAAPGAGLTAVDQVGLDIHGKGFTAGDIDAAGGIVTATLAVTEGTLVVNAGNSGVAVANSNSATVTVTGRISQISNLLSGVATGTVVYTAIAAPSATTTITVTVNDGGNSGRDPGTSGDATSEEASASQTIANTSSNTPPTLVGLDGAPVFSEGGVPVLIDADVTVGDTEQNWDGGTATVSGLDGFDSVAVRNFGTGAGQSNVAGTTISVGVTPVASFTGGVSGTDLVITFNASATNADVEAVLENLVYSNASDAPVATRTLTITIADEAGADASGAVTATVNAVNDAPSTNVAAATGNEDAASISIDLSGTDVDGTVASFRITSLPANGTLFSDAALNNPVALNSTVAATGSAVTLFFVPNPDFSGTPTFTFAVIDNLGLEDASAATATITVSAVNDAPQTAAASGTGSEDAASIAVALSGSDIDGTVASFRITSLPAGGVLFSDAALNNPVALNDTVAATGNAATLFFVPNANFNGAPTFTFAAIDNLGLEDASAATATITVSTVNDAPQTVAASGTGAEDAASIAVALSGSDVDGTVASFRIISLPSDGTLFSNAALNNPVALNDTVTATGNAVTMFFVPDANSNGTPSFTFSAIDNLGLEDASPATATITVTAVNDAPQTADASGTGAEDAVSIAVALSGSDVDGNVASFRVTSLPGDGVLFSDAALNNPVALSDTVAATGNAATLFFVPNANFNGAPTFTFAAIDNLGLEDASAATATITVSTVNDAPQTAAASGTGAEDAASIAVALSGSDVDGTVGSFKITSLPADGVLFSDAALTDQVALNDTIAATGNAATLFFVPNANFNGTPTFTFAAIDNLGLEDASPATATITVTAVNDAPETNLATGAGDEDAASISVALSGSDGDGTVASFRITSLPTDGVLYSNAALTNQVVLNDSVAATGNAVTLFFVPDANFSGTPSFTFAAIDNLGLEDTTPATATITVSADNDAPETNAVVAVGAEDAASISVAISGGDIDGNVASFRITSLPSDGTLFSDAALNNPVALNGTVTATGNAATLFFVPNTNFNGTPSFTFAAIDNLGLEDASPATATIKVTAVNDAPQTAAATGTGAEDAASIAVALSGSDIDGTVASFRITSLPADGVLFSDAALNNPVALNDAVAATGNAATLFFVPNANFNGAPTFTFTAIDNLGLEDASAATATITVGTVNDAPQTAAATGTGAEDAASIAVALSGSDIDGTVASFRITSLPADGVLFSDAALTDQVALNDTIAATGNAATLFFVPDANFNGTPTFTFAAIDNLGLEDASPAAATITVTAVNDAPETNLATGAGDEDAASISVALSGSDGDGTLASFRITSLPTDGVLYSNAALTNQVAPNDSVAATGNAVTLFFVPDANFSGTPSFTFAAIDNLGLEDTTPATATITVGADNDAPETNAVVAAGVEDAASISVAISGTDIDGTVASFRITGLPSDGTLFSDAALNNPVALNSTVAATGNVATLFFVPDADFNGTPSFTFAAIDNLGLEDASPASATITVGAVNDAPTTNVATAAGNEDTAVISVALSGADVDGNVASFKITSLPSDGTLFSDAALNNPVALNGTVAATGNAATLFFVPDADFNGTPSFTFAAIDDLGLEDVSAATTTITVSAVNDAPQTAAGSGIGNEDAASISIALSGSDDDGNVASFRITSLPSDGILFSDAALNNPVALNDTVTTTGNSATLFFVPNPNFNGTPSFTFAAVDDLGLEDASPETATITVSTVNDAPQTAAATGTGAEDAASIAVALSGSDIDGTVASFRVTSLPSDGTLFSDAALNNPVALNDTIAATGNAATLFFVPNPNFNGTPTFTFAAIDDLGLEDASPANATITVGAVNDAPQTNVATGTGNEDAASISVDLSGSDTDGTVASFRITSLPSDGTLFSDAALNNPVALNDTVAATGNTATLFFVPNANFNGTPTFTFAAIDDLGLEDDTPATATITVNSVNDAPTTNIAAATGNEDATSISVALPGGDVDGNVASFRITGLPADGVLFSDAALNNPIALNDTIAAAGNAATLFFVPNANFNGAPTFTLAAIDNLGLEDATPATATITVNAINDAPAITDLGGDVSVALAGGEATSVDDGVNATASDLDGATDFDGGFVTFDITAGTDNGSFSFAGVNVTSGGDATITANETIRVGGTIIGTVSSVAGQDGQGGNLLRIDFDAGSSTPASLSTLIQSLSYAAPSGFGDRTLTTTLNDGDGTTNGGADETVVVSTIRVPVAPQVQSIERQDPASAETNADSVTFRVTFDTNVNEVDTNDFVLSGTLAATSSVTGVTQVSDTVYDVTVDVPDNGDGTINLDISATPTIQNGAGINIRTSAAPLGADETYTIDNTAPAIPLADLATASDRGASNTDDITNDITPVITGTVDANTNVTILSSIDGQVGQDSAATYNGAGIMTSALSDGVHTLTILSTDVAGNSSMTQLTITIDTIAPTATSIGSPIAPADDAVVTFSETVSFNNGAANFMTTLNAGAIVQDNFLATNANTSLSGGNTLTFVRPTALALGSAFSAQFGAGLVTDIAGNTNTALTDLTTLVFETFGIPAAPAGLDLIAPSDTGQSSTDDITADTTPTITGTADANATINLTSSLDGLVGTTQADAAGNWSITTSALRDGIHDFTATATNPAAIGPASTILSITVDTTIQTPATPDLTAASDTGASPTDNVTFDKTPTLTGTAEPGATVTLNSSISGTVGTAVASAAGNWTMTTGTLPEGDHVFTVGMVDIAGNISPQSAGLTVTIGTETTVAGGDPQTPTTGGTETGGQGSTGTDGSDIAGLGANNDGPAGPWGQATSGPNFDGSDAPIGSGFAGANTSDGGLPPAGRAPQGADPIITAGLGDQRSPTGDVPSESDLPGSISLDPASDSGLSDSDNRTGESQPVFIGEAPANSIVTITSSLGGILGTARVDETGKWTFKSPSLADGQHELIATPADEEGNKGVPSLPLLATIDTSAPETPAPPAFDGDIDQFRSNDSQTFRGKAEPGARLVLTSDQDGVVGEVIADENGNWQITGEPLSENAHALKVTATDEAGNSSAPSSALNIVVRGAVDTALNFDPEDSISIDVTQMNGSIAFDTIDMTGLLKGFTRDIEGFGRAQVEHAPAPQAVGFTRQLQRADAERLFA